MGMVKSIKYIGFYDILRDGVQKRSYSLAWTKKMDYICSVLNQLGYEVELVSPAMGISRVTGMQRTKHLLI